ncbi:MAG: hypothetical protein CVU59_00225 [Deltaproteobacteria bacterium HGW-Deltaproteobacteria-17]|nr:MAG: hypothetical protein CVU59_00225 [Deltaproteobacteria bacterium HGW-Deltaproteobacteria-17]
MNKQVFLSYVFEDIAYRDQIVDWYRKGLLGKWVPVFEKEDVRQGGDAAIRGHLRPILRDADAVLVLVGQDTHNRRWVNEEVHFLATSGKAILWTRIPNSTGGAPPELRSKAVVQFSPEEIRQALDSAR